MKLLDLAVLGQRNSLTGDSLTRQLLDEAILRQDNSLTGKFMNREFLDRTHALQNSEIQIHLKMINYHDYIQHMYPIPALGQS